MLRAVCALVGFFAVVAAGCTDPCTQLAERICNCETVSSERFNCLAVRVTQQQGRLELTDEDLAFCATRLDTCTCASIDDNDLDACGFTPGDGGSISP